MVTSSSDLPCERFWIAIKEELLRLARTELVAEFKNLLGGVAAHQPAKSRGWKIQKDFSLCMKFFSANINNNQVRADIVLLCHLTACKTQDTNFSLNIKKIIACHLPCAHPNSINQIVKCIYVSVPQLVCWVLKGANLILISSEVCLVWITKNSGLQVSGHKHKMWIFSSKLYPLQLGFKL